MTRASESDLEPVLVEARADSPTYPPSGRPVFRRDRWWRVLGAGDAAFRAACDALRTWEMHRGAGLVVLAEGPPVPGQTVAMSAPLPIGAITLACRVTDVVDESNRFGFTYATLPDHPEIGEESFTVIRNDADEVGLEIVAVWRLRHPLARLAPPVARLLQRQATERYLTAMDHLVAGTPPTPH